jgi:hypothetical protein
VDDFDLGVQDLETDYVDDAWTQRYQDTDGGDGETEDGVIWLDGFPFRVENRGIYTNMSTFDRPIQQGDPSRNTDAIISTRVYSDLSGGGQIYEERADTTNRYHFSTLNTRHINLVTLNRRVRTYRPASAPAGGVYPLGVIGEKAWIAFGPAIYGWNPVNQEIDLTPTATMPTEPVGKAVLYYGKLWIPRGSGYTVFDGSALLDNNNTIHAIDFTVWDQKVIAITQENRLRIYLQAGTPGWVAVPSTDPLKPPAGEPRGVGVFKLNDEKTLHMLTDERAYSYDAAGPRIIETDLEFPPHPYAAAAYANWQNDFYVSTSTQVITYTGGSRDNNRGLDRDDGLPEWLDGGIVDLTSEYNGMYALVEGPPVESTPRTLSMDLPLVQDNHEGLPDRVTRSALMYWTGFGWHTLWVSGTEGAPTWSMVVPSRANPKAYGIMWGYGNQLYYCPLIYLNSNPVKGMVQGVDEFAETGYLDFAYYGFNLYGYPKTASHFRCRVPIMPTGSRVRVLYRVDEDDAYTIMGDITEPGDYSFAFGDPLPNLGVGEGIGFERIQMRYEVERQAEGTVTLHGRGVEGWEVPAERASPVIDSAVLHILKEPLEGTGFEFTLAFDGDEDMNLSGQQQADIIDQLVRAGRFIEMQIGRKFYRTRLAYVNGDQPAGDRPPENRRISAVVVATGLEPVQLEQRVRRTASTITNRPQ